MAQVDGTPDLIRHVRSRKFALIASTFLGLTLIALAVGAQSRATLGAAFERRVLVPPPEAPFPLRLFSGPVKTDSRGRIITGPTSDPRI